jgi:hypothetical protein
MTSSTSPPQPSRTTRLARVLAPVGVVAIALGGFAAAQAATDHSENDSPRDAVERPNVGQQNEVVDAPATTNPANTAVTPVTLPDGTAQTFAAGAAGAVTVGRNGSTLAVVSVSASPGFTPHTEIASGPQVEIEFDGATTRVNFEAEIEDGGVIVTGSERAVVHDDQNVENEIENENEVENENEIENEHEIEIENEHEGVDDHSGADANRGPGSVNSGPGSVNSGSGEDGDHSGTGSGGSGSGSGGSSDSGHSGSGGSGDSGHGGGD